MPMAAGPVHIAAGTWLVGVSQQAPGAVYNRQTRLACSNQSRS